jgi:hypothetical protein
VNTLKIKAPGRADFHLKKSDLDKLIKDDLKNKAAVLDRLMRDDRKSRAALLVEFLGYRFDQKRAIPQSLGLVHSLKIYNMNKSRKLKAVMSVQADLKKLLEAALDALAGGDLVGEPMSRLIEAFADLKGAPYVYERNLVGTGQLGDSWIRRPLIAPGSLRNFYLSLVAELFDAGKINLLGHCRHCGRFFVTRGHGRPPKYCPPHGDNVASNERLRAGNYFSNRYKKLKRQKIQKARRLWKDGYRRDELLRLSGLGKTTLKKERLWDSEDDLDREEKEKQGRRITGVRKKKEGSDDEKGKIQKRRSPR